MSTMNNWQVTLNQYKHYFLILAALLLANYALVPLSELQTEQQQTLALLAKKQQKLNGLIVNEQQFEHRAAMVNQAYEELLPYMFSEKTEAQFKLKAQSKIEDVLNKADCKVERIGFKGSTQVSENISRWLLELRFKGDSVCMVKTSRGLETMIPNVRVESFNFNHRALKKEGEGNLNAQLSINVWHLSGGAR